MSTRHTRQSPLPPDLPLFAVSPNEFPTKDIHHDHFDMMHTHRHRNNQLEEMEREAYELKVAIHRMGERLCKLERYFYDDDERAMYSPSLTSASTPAPQTPYIDDHWPSRHYSGT